MTKAEPLTDEGIEQMKRCHGYFPDDPAPGVIKIAEADFIALIATVESLKVTVKELSRINDALFERNAEIKEENVKLHADNQKLASEQRKLFEHHANLKKE